MTLLSSGDTVGLIACSDGIRKDQKGLIENVINTLKGLDLNVILAKTLYRTIGSFSGTGEERASELMRLFKDDRVKVIFDVSGGDLANQLLPHLDYDLIQKKAKPYVGISDLSVLLNAIYHRSKVPTFHYQIRNLVSDDAKCQLDYFKHTFFNEQKTNYNLKWIRGEQLEGTVIGGNLRCFLKLAGTEYLPDPSKKILFLESLGGRDNRIASYLTQLQQIGYFDKVSGILLGTFSQMEGEEITPKVEELVLEMTKNLEIPIVKTNDLGHNQDAKCIVIGDTISLTK